MSIRQCPECGHYISDRAPRCPSCKATKSKMILKEQGIEHRPLEGVSYALNNFGRFLWEAKLVIILLIVFALFFLYPIWLISSALE